MSLARGMGALLTTIVRILARFEHHIVRLHRLWLFRLLLSFSLSCCNAPAVFSWKSLYFASQAVLEVASLEVASALRKSPVSPINNFAARTERIRCEWIRSETCGTRECHTENAYLYNSRPTLLVVIQWRISGVFTGWPCSAPATRFTPPFCLELAMAQR